MDLISVIVPVYNVEEYLPRCIESIIGQTYSDLEIILVDDGSLDGSGRICDEYKAIDNRIVVVHKQNGGASSARNIGLENSRGEYIGFVDGDDYIAPNMYEQLLDSLIRYNADFATGGIVEKRLDGSELMRGCQGNGIIIQNREEAFIDFFVKLKYNRSSCCCKLFKRKVINDERFTLGTLGEDVDFIYRIIDRSNAIVCINTPVYYYDHRETSTTSAGVSERSFDMIRMSDRITDFFKKKYPELMWTVNVARFRWILDIRRCLRKGSKEHSLYAERLDKMVRREYFRYVLCRNFPKSSWILMQSMTMGIFDVVYPLIKELL